MRRTGLECKPASLSLEQYIGGQEHLGRTYRPSSGPQIEIRWRVDQRISDLCVGHRNAGLGRDDAREMVLSAHLENVRWGSPELAHVAGRILA